MAVRTPKVVRYTRCGQLTMNEDNELVTSVGGYAVLNDQGERMTCTVRPQNVMITRDGYVIVPASEFAQSGDDKKPTAEIIGKMGVFEFASPNLLKSEGQNVLSSPEDAPKLSEKTVITQYGLEESNVSPMEESIRLIEIFRLFEHSQKMIDEYAQIRKKTINVSGRNSV